MSSAATQQFALFLRSGARPAVLLGAGASKTSGAPLGANAALELLADLYGHTLTSAELIERFKREARRPFTFSDVVTYLGPGAADKRLLLEQRLTTDGRSLGYDWLAQLIVEGLLAPIVLTVNYQDLTGSALLDAGVSPHLIRDVEPEEYLASPTSADGYSVIHLHGGFDTDLKATSAEMLRLSRAGERIVQDVLENHGLLVVGYGGADIGVRRALQTPEPAAEARLWWVSPEPLDSTRDEELLETLRRHDAIKRMIIGETFDSLFESLATPVAQLATRRRETAQFTQAWELLDECRTSGARRGEALLELKLVAGALVGTGLDEASALIEFAAYEEDKILAYRLIRGVTLLERAINGYNRGHRVGDTADEDVLLELEFQLLDSYWRRFLAGDVLATKRVAALDRLIERCQTLLDRTSPDDSHIGLRLRVALGEALKEKSHLTHEPAEHQELYLAARTQCATVLAALEDDNGPTALRLRGRAHRHRAVTYELQAEHAHERAERLECYDRWSSDSQRGARLAAQAGDDATQAFALMNAASAEGRLADAALSEDEKQARSGVAAGYLADALRLAEDLGDIRSTGWTWVHQCEHLERKLQFGGEDHAALKVELELAAHRAVALLRRIEDPLGWALAQVQLGNALMLRAEDPIEGELSTLVSASAALTQAIELVKDTGFYRAGLHAALSYARCQRMLWTASSDRDLRFIERGAQALLSGLADLYLGQEAEVELVKLFELLVSEAVRR